MWEPLELKGGPPPFDDEDEGASRRDEVLEVCWFVVLTFPLAPETDDWGRKLAVIGSKH